MATATVAAAVVMDITMKADENVGPVAFGPTQIGLALGRAVLEERFAFSARRETRGGYLTNQLQRVAIDRTGLAGVWDFELTFTRPTWPRPQPMSMRTLFTGLQE